MPPLSRVTIEEPTASAVSFTPDRLGTYLVDLMVSDGEFTVTSSVLVTLLSDAERPIAFGGSDRIVAVGSEVVLDGTASEDLLGRYLHFEWRLIEVPDGSTVELLSPDPIASFTPDVEGLYRAEITVHNGSVESVADEVVVEAKPDSITAGDVPNTGFLPEQVYAMGAPDGDFCTFAFAHWSDFDTLVGGINRCDESVSSIPKLASDGSLHYLAAGVLRRFVCDDCPTWSQGMPLPKAPNDNDTVIDTSICVPKTDGTPTDFLEGADGRRLLQCGGGWRDDQGRTVKNIKGAIIAYDGTFALTTTGDLLDFAKGTTTAVAAWPSIAFTARTTTGGFWAYSDHALWFVDTTAATATMEHEYGAYPMLFEPFVYYTALDADGNSIERIYNYESGLVEVWRRRLDGVVDRQERFSKSGPWMSAPQAFLTGP